ncbi:LOW QUALITY PROTEIN: neuropeptide CCHamide-2 receptor-like [Homalodisca vitripennis]|uniref:LOW QUALITY PROTEIN: neuropeptide CCHamide-2 receptor-like n=1 Tax=Homalodisca vitripennis TaxID=197043 RepID=UPI001EEC8E37|nr:LOW QUALITY PROTEIN: neuropeptide CCHamide-2 receptor-like [Homalodisca vitripennis]
MERLGNLTEEEYIPYSQRPETYIVPVVFAIIFIVGVLGNGTLVFIFARHKRMRNIPNTYIFSLALGDLLVIVSCVPFTSILYTLESWPWGGLICKLSEATKDVSIGVSVFTLTALSAERYCAIVNPIRRHISTKPLTIVTALAIWMVSLILALPAAIFSNVQSALVQDNRTIEYCSPFPKEFGKDYEKGVVMIKFLVYYAFPIWAIASFYILMARHLLLSTRTLPREHCKSQTNKIQARKKVARMVLAFVMIFIICFLPYHIFMLWFHFYSYSYDAYDAYWHAFRIVGFCLSYMNSCINPIALYYVSETYYKHFNRYLICCLRSKSQYNDVNLVHVSSSSDRRQNSFITSHYSLSHAGKS